MAYGGEEALRARCPCSSVRRVRYGRRPAFRATTRASQCLPSSSSVHAMRIVIQRAQGGQVVIDDAQVLAVEFFERDISSAGEESYDERARRTDPREPFTQDDADAIREGMRLDRLRGPTWDWLIDESPR